MGLRDIVELAVAIAHSQTVDLQSEVKFERSLGDDGSGSVTYASPVMLPAAVDWKQRRVRTMAGQEATCRASILFTDKPKLLAATNNLGVNEQDRITLQDGTMGPILDMGGFIDRADGIPFATEVFLG